MNRLDFAGLIASRICHDLSSPVSVIANGIELIADEADPEQRIEIGQLVSASASVLVSRLRCYRLLFSGGPELPAPLVEARSALAEYLSGNDQVSLDWTSGVAPRTRTELRLLLALAITAAEAVEGGGTITIETDSAGWRVAATGPRITLSSEQRAALKGAPSDDVRPRCAIAVLAAALAESIGVTVTVADTSTRLTFGVPKR